LTDCPKKGTPKDKWSINNPNNVNATQLSTVAASSADAAAPKSCEGGLAWQSVQLHTAGVRSAVSMAQQPRLQHMRDWILLDSESSVDLFCNPKLINNIVKSSSTLYLGTNAGGMSIDQEAEVPNYKGKVWLDEKAMTNVFSMALMEDKYRITYDSAVESAFVVHTELGPVKFVRGPENLYYYKPRYRTTTDSLVATSLVETVTENESFYTPRQIETAKKAKSLLHSLGCPSVNDLKNILRLNMIADCPVKIQDVILAEKFMDPILPA
jgi:hypothetical protein